MPSAGDFYKDLRALREQYPMCYIEAWTPEDFAIERSAPVAGSETPDWKDEKWELVAEELSDSFDANNGTNWDAIAMAKERLGL